LRSIKLIVVVPAEKTMLSRKNKMIATIDKQTMAHIRHAKSLGPKSLPWSLFIHAWLVARQSRLLNAFEDFRSVRTGPFPIFHTKPIHGPDQCRFPSCSSLPGIKQSSVF
jgi:hypothetical protein